MTQELTVRQQGTYALTPQDVVDVAVEQSRLLMRIVEQTKCYQIISGKKYLQVEAWETIGAFNRTHAETESITPIRGLESNVDPTEITGYQAHVQLWKDGVVVGGAIMPCYFTENCCKGKDGDAKHKASMSAAQTFATSKAYRMNYSYVAILAGYQPLPAEEVTEDMTEVDKTEHWCEKHHTKFFKTEKMKAWAHPVKNEDGSQVVDENGKPLWCSEKAEKPQPKAKPEPSPEATKPKSDVVTGQTNGNVEQAEKDTQELWPQDEPKEPTDKDETPITPEQTAQLTELMKTAGMTLAGLGKYMNADKQWNVRKLGDLQAWQFNQLCEAFQRGGVS